MAQDIELQYPLGSYSVVNPPSNNTLMGDLSTVQTAVNTINSEIEAKADASALTAHEADTSTHGVTTVAGLNEAQTLTNKTLSTAVKLDANADENITQYGMARQAIMNGNFDVWQRGTSVAVTDGATIFQADRFCDITDKNGGTLPTLTRTRQTITSGEIPGAKYFSRLTTNGAGTSLGVSSHGEYAQRIEHGTSKLCGLNKQVTLSFWARSDIANKRICPTLFQYYGSGGSPSAIEFIKGTPITLTSTWTKYTATFTTNTLASKTFGTDNNDYLTVSLNYMWGSTWGDTYVQTGVTAETFRGAGNIDIAQVQLCAGDVALPFQPKSYEEELRACMRYCEFLDGTPGKANSTTTGIFNVKFRNTKPRVPATGDIAFIAGANASENGIGARTFTGVGAVQYAGQDGFELILSGASGLTVPNIMGIVGQKIYIQTEL